MPWAGTAAAAPADSLAAPPAAVRRWQLGLGRADRVQHASLAFTLACGAVRVDADPVHAFTGVFLLGFAKECWDARRGAFDTRDLAADALGAAAGALAGR